VRVLRLTVLFHRTRRVHAPPGSMEDAVVRRTLGDLVRERDPLPGPDDEEELRTPIDVTWARRVAGTRLVITYAHAPPVVEVRSVRPAW
jgi:hypothetical protein